MYSFLLGIEERARVLKHEDTLNSGRLLEGFLWHKTVPFGHLLCKTTMLLESAFGCQSGHQN